MTSGTAWQIVLVFGAASLLSFGGGNSVVPELQAQAVGRQWMTARQFADSFAIAQVAPGPSSLLVTLLGYRLAGISGALLATVAMVLPAALLMYATARVWRGSEGARWHRALEGGIAPLAVALSAASGIVVARSVDQDGLGAALSLAAAVLLGATKCNPSIVVLGGGLLAVLLRH